MAANLNKASGKGDVKKRLVTKKSDHDKQDATTKNPEIETKPTTKSSFIRNIIRSSLKYIFLVIIIPPLLNYAALIREETEFRKTGDLNETLHGQKLFVQCQGEGKPTVILDAPTGLNSDVWIHIFNKVSKISKVCIYDRAGIGFSERPKTFKNGNQTTGISHTTERMVDDLRYLFSNNSHAEKPFLLVGAELGAVNARFYAQMYQDDVSSLVLINPIFEGIFAFESGKWKDFWFGPFLASWQRLRILAVSGLSRLGLRFGALKEIVDNESLPENIKMRQKHLMCKPEHLYSAVEEHYFLNESLAQLRLLHRIRPLPKTIPVSIITSSKFSESAPQEINRLWKESQHLNKKSFQETPTEIRSETAASRLLIAEYQIIFTEIKKQIMKWRTDTKRSAKY